MAENSPALLTSLLRQVSRSFYLTLRVLPGAIRPQIGLAYLLARASDTIADTDLLPVATRLAALQALRDRIQGRRAEPLDFAEIARCQGASGAGNRDAASLEKGSQARPAIGSAAERLLLERIEEMLGWLERFSGRDTERIREVIEIITSGQVLDLERFASAAGNRIIALQTDRELDDYTYRVAGCVGEFWTHLCRFHLFPRAPLEESSLLANGVRFGKGLQLVNILRDIPADLRQGRCYIPAEALQARGLTPAALLDPSSEGSFRPAFQSFCGRAQAHLAAGWAYTNALPRRCVRVRLACAWPILIGARTLEHLRAGNVLQPAQRIKVSRAEVRNLMARSLACYPWPRAWNRLFGPLSAGPATPR